MEQAAPVLEGMAELIAAATALTRAGCSPAGSEPRWDTRSLTATAVIPRACTTGWVGRPLVRLMTARTGMGQPGRSRAISDAALEVSHSRVSSFPVLG